MNMQTYTANGVTVTYPVGYRAVQDYAVVLRLNLAQLQQRPPRFFTPARVAQLITRYKADIALCKAAGIV